MRLGICSFISFNRENPTKCGIYLFAVCVIMNSLIHFLEKTRLKYYLTTLPTAKYSFHIGTNIKNVMVVDCVG